MIIPLALAVGGCASHHAKKAPPATADDAYPYHKPLSTQGERFGSLPDNVKATVLAEVGTIEIIDVIKQIRAGHVVYKIRFKDAADYPPLFVASDGSVLNPDMTVAVPAPLGPTTIKFADLPLSALRVVRERAPDAEVAKVNVETWGDHTIYIISFVKDLKYPKLYVVADGTSLTMAPTAMPEITPAAKP